ncbi:hypothetical protein [Clostridium saccharoperbutylacetonicum]|uniref:hypothetical protein n=1 Tax=Clostridium saccharoperbutylacetonicum TaxID=36745 RepID=UPI0039EAE935
MDTDIDKCIQKQIQRRYQSNKEMIEKSISDYELYILNKYKKEYHLKILSIYYLMRFRNKLSKLVLLPPKDEYEKISKTNELFDTSMLLSIHIGKQDLELRFPLIVNVSKLSHYIENQNYNKVSFNIDDLLAIMTEGYHEDYEIDNEIRTNKRDILYKEKEKNSIIIMQGSRATRYTIINGNHRIMHYSMIEERAVNGYYVTSEECCKFALTKDYEKLYKMILHLIDKVNGSINIEKNIT